MKATSDDGAMPHGQAHPYEKRMDTRRTMTPKTFTLPTFQFKKHEKHQTANEPQLMFKEYFPNKAGFTLEQNQTYRRRVNDRVMKEITRMAENEGAKNLLRLNSKEMIATPLNVERTNAFLQVLVRKKLDVKKIANEELIKLNNELMGKQRAVLYTMHTEQKLKELSEAKKKNEKRRFALMLRQRFEDRRRFRIANQSKQEKRIQKEIQEYLDNMLRNHENESLSSQILNRKRQELKVWREQLQHAKPLTYDTDGQRPANTNLNLRKHVNIRQYAEDRHRSKGPQNTTKRQKTSPIKLHCMNRPATTQSARIHSLSTLNGDFNKYVRRPATRANASCSIDESARALDTFDWDKFIRNNEIQGDEDHQQRVGTEDASQPSSPQVFARSKAERRKSMILKWHKIEDAAGGNYGCSRDHLIDKAVAEIDTTMKVFKAHLKHREFKFLQSLFFSYGYGFGFIGSGTIGQDLLKARRLFASNLQWNKSKKKAIGIVGNKFRFASLMPPLVPPCIHCSLDHDQFVEVGKKNLGNRYLSIKAKHTNNHLSATDVIGQYNMLNKDKIQRQEMSRLNTKGKHYATIMEVQRVTRGARNLPGIQNGQDHHRAQLKATVHNRILDLFGNAAKSMLLESPSKRGINHELLDSMYHASEDDDHSLASLMQSTPAYALAYNNLTRDGFGFQSIPTKYSKLIHIYEEKQKQKQEKSSGEISAGSESDSVASSRDTRSRFASSAHPDYKFWRLTLRRKKQRKAHRHRRHLHHLCKLSSVESATAREVFRILRVNPIARLKFLRQLATRKYEAESILEQLYFVACLIERREKMLEKIWSLGRQHQWSSNEFTYLQDQFIDVTHEIGTCIINMYNLHKFFVEYDGEFYLKKMKKDDVTLGATKGTDKLKMFSKVVIPLVNSMMNDTRYGGLRL